MLTAFLFYIQLWQFSVELSELKCSFVTPGANECKDILKVLLESENREKEKFLTKLLVQICFHFIVYIIFFIQLLFATF